MLFHKSPIRSHQPLPVPFPRTQPRGPGMLGPQMLRTLAAADRTLARPGGCLLLPGRAGAGRRSMVTLAAAMQHLEVFTPKMHRNYTTKAFMADIKTVAGIAGVDGQELVFLLEDYQLQERTYTELVNSLLSTGEVPGLYKPAELEPLLAPLKDLAAEQGWRGSLYSFFLQRIKNNLHLVLILDSTRSEFSYTCESNPAFFKHCKLLWMSDLPVDTMQQIPRMLLQGQVPDAVLTPELLQHITLIHDSCRGLGATPTAFAAFIKGFATVHNEKRDAKEQRVQRFQAGLQKLQEAAARVDELKAQASEQQLLCAQKQQEADLALREITEAMAGAGAQKVEAEALKASLATEEAKLAQRQKAIEVELAVIEPAIQAAKKAVGAIESKSLTEIRAFRAPPDAVRDILQAVLMLMGIFDTSWQSMRSFLAKRGVQDEIVNFDQRKITSQVREAVEDLIRTHSSSFDEVVAKRASRAAAPLAAWVTANLQYATVLEKVAPLEAENSALKRTLGVSQEKLAKLTFDLSQIDGHVAKLKARFEGCTQEGARLKWELDRASGVIVSAESLIGKLVNERRRWDGTAHQLLEEIDSLPAGALLASAFLVYLPKASEDDRELLMSRWRMTVDADSFDFLQFMTTESEQLTWKANGLPADQQCLQNAMVVLKAPQAPLLVDPSSSADAWLRETLKDSRLEVVNQADANFTTALELAIRFGKTLLVQEVDTIEPMLYPILRRDLVAQGPRFCVQVGDKMIDFVEDFRLYMTTRHSSPDIAPDAAALITQVNFTITRAGLVGQLLARTIEHDQPALETRKTALLRQEEQMKLQLNDLEEALLRELATSEGNILENKVLLDSLNETKAKASVISESLTASLELQLSLDQQRDVYRGLAEVGSRLFFVIKDLNKINNMYQFSLASFLVLFDRVLRTEDDGSGPDLRARLLGNALQKMAYNTVCRSLFKADRLMFAIHLVHGMYPEAFKANEWEFFTGILTGGSAAFRRQQSVERLHAQVPSWVPKERALDVSALSTTFPQLGQALELGQAELWADWARSPQCELEFPTTVQRRIEAFQQLMVVQCIRPDRLQSAMMKFACDKLGLRALFPPMDSLRTLFEADSRPGEPILLLVSAGTDPSHELQALADDVVGANRFHQVAMGQGQAVVAEEKLQLCATHGGWLVLKNVHLVTPWLTQLENLLNSVREPHKDFRLWLTTEPHPKFPPVLLQSSLKVTIEAPPGVKMNMTRTYEAWSQDFIAQGSSLRAQSLFALAWFHAIMQERRTYIPQGWTKAYEFSAADLRASSQVISRVCEAATAHGSDPKWEDVCGLMINALYGGRVDNQFDVRVMMTYLRQYFNSDVIPSAGRARSKLHPGITLPTSTHRADYVQVIRNLPDQDTPGMFGLPDNVDRSAQRAVSRQVITQLKILMRSDALAGGFNREVWFRELTPVLQMWRRLNDGGDLLSSEAAPPPDHDVDALAAFVALERCNAVSWVATVDEQLTALGHIIKGTALLTPQLMALGRSLLLRQTPESWLRLWEGPEDPTQWCRSLVAKALSLSAWVEQASRGTLLDAPVNLGQLFHPDTFLNALRQQTSRALLCPMDELQLACNWSAASNAPHAVTLGELRLEGCTFDRTRLGETNRDSPSVVMAPPCQVEWVAANHAPSKTDTMSLPLYMTSDRDKIITCLNVPVGNNAARWVLTGAAFFIASS